MIASSVRHARINNKTRFPSRFLSSSNKSSKNWRQNGTPEIIVGTSILSLLLVDLLIQKYNESTSTLSRKAVIRELEVAIKEDERLLKNDLFKKQSFSTKSTSSSSSSPSSSTRHPLIDIDGKECATLYKCEIMKLPKYFDGTKSLKNVQIHDIVHVIQEFVGPDSTYHLCRIDKKTNCNDDNDNSQKKTKIVESLRSGKTEDEMIEYLEARYEYGWFPITCMKKL